MRKFEYKVLHYCEELDNNTTEEWNKLGQEGWELVGFGPYAMNVSGETDECTGRPVAGSTKGSFTWVAAAFKREIED